MNTRNPHMRARQTSSSYTHVYNYGRGGRPAAASLGHPMVRRVPARFKLVAFVLLALFMSGHFAWSQHVSAQAEATKRQQQALVALQAHKAAIFADQVEVIMTAHPELRMAVAVAPHSGSAQQFGKTNVFDAASTGKLITAAAYLRLVDQGKLSLTTSVQGRSVQSWLKPMIIDSDDTAWSALNANLGHPKLEAFARSIGITDYDADTNTLTPADISELLRQLYDRQLLSSSSRSLLLSYMAAANYRDFAVAGVPSGDLSYHKIGMDEDNVHDALIIAHGDQSVVLTIFTDGGGSYNWDARQDIMQSITKAAIAAYLTP